MRVKFNIQKNKSHVDKKDNVNKQNLEEADKH